MKANPTQSDKARDAVALLSSRVTLHPNASAFWESRAHLNAPTCRDASELCALLVVEYVSRVIAKSIELADARHEAGGIAMAEGLTRDERFRVICDAAPRQRKGRGKLATLTPTDRDEIASEVSRVLAFQGAYDRPLDADDWSKCFSRVQSRDCLDLNRKWKPCADGEATLQRLSAPTFDLHTEAERLPALAAKVEQAREWVQAAYEQDGSRKRESTRRKMLETLEALASGKVISGNGTDKRTQRKARKAFRDYLAAGQAIVAAKRLSRSEWMPLEALSLA